MEPNERKPLPFELRTGSEKQETEFYKEMMSRVASSRCIIFMIPVKIVK